METGPILIYDMVGNLVKSELQSLPAKMDITTLKPGIYTVTTGNLSRRFVKQ
ncbi:MAG: T9SS type A sorting domain-containing protein [Bacteroidetes bacterium]|nr:T9SS type A sorting domain-containing protein [Bacteroidota bacterium]